MAEYIEREALIDDIEAAMDNGGMGYSIGQTLKRYVKRQPSADVAPVVRCKDCRMATEDFMIDGWYHCENNLMTHSPDCFCSYGERKDEE